MLRCTIELVPGGDERRKHVIGLVEIVNIGGDPGGKSNYAVVLKKTAPYQGALRAAWKKGLLEEGELHIENVTTGETDEVVAARVQGFNRVTRGCYDLLYVALRACGLGNRNMTL